MPGIERVLLMCLARALSSRISSRSFLLAIAVLVFSPEALADDDAAASTSTIESGGYGAPELKLTSVNGSAGLLLGSQGGWIINHHFVLGGAGYGLATDAESVSNGTKTTIDFGYGGVRPAVIVGSEASMFHLTGGVLLGGMGVSRDGGSSAVTWVIEPDLGAEMTVKKWLRVSLAGTYRIAGAASDVNLRSGQLSGPAASLAVKFGAF